MFTGLIEELGTVVSLERRESGAHLGVRARKVLEGTRVGDSIAVSGVCLTVVEIHDYGFVADCMPETLRLSTLGKVTHGAAVNLERSLAAEGRLGGHIVLGHVDAVAEILAARKRGIALELKVSLPETLRACVAPKGSIAIDGISLTVTNVEGDAFGVGVIPHTLRETSLSVVKSGMLVNLEVDVLARYVLRVLQVMGDRKGYAVGGDGLTEQLLREQGFV